MLIPCPACTRHLRDHETSCPFCKTPLDVMAVALATALALAACKDPPPRDAEVYGGPPPVERTTGADAGATEPPRPKTDGGAAPDSGSQKR